MDVSRAMMPNVEVFATDTEVVVKAELPGMAPDQVEVEVTEDSIHLSGELKQEEVIKEDSYYRSERQFGQFERLIPLPNRIKDTEAKASFKNGILEIRAPLAEEVKRPAARKLEIES
jgi:HSP20 family protein